MKRLNQICIAVLALGCTLAKAQQTAAPQSTPTLTESAKAAVDLARSWNDGENASAVTIDSVGRVKYTYGPDMPTIVCAVLRVCTLELEPGERATGDLQVGDSSRWNFSLLQYGPEGNETEAIAISPKVKGQLDTNIMVPTNRRIYYIHLVSDPRNYMARVSFTYPEDAKEKWRKEVSQNTPPPPAAQPLAPPINADAIREKERENVLSSLNVNYTISGGKNKPCMVPTKVFDDAHHTVIEMPPCADGAKLPMLFIQGDKGQSTMNNRYDPEHQRFVVDDIFDHAKLQKGTSKRAAREAVHIDRDGAAK